MERLMTTEEVADYLRIPKATLYNLNYKRSGPRYIRVGRHNRYRESEVLRWTAEQTCGYGS